jgi:phospholipid-binding lipoprotein MlaA
MTHKIFLFHRVLFPAIIGSLILLSGCSAIPEKQAGETPAQHPVDSVVREDISYPIDVYDPWEGFNRGMYRFNAGFDRYVFLPVVGAYAAVMPDPVEDSISNFFNNLFEITNLSNSILQLDAEDSINTTWRIIINTTFGLAGLFDVATEMGM